MRVLLITLGSHGDIHPFFALSRALSSRGHQPLLATNPAFAPQAARAGVPMTPLADALDMAEIVRRPDVMHRTRGPKAVLKDLLLPVVPEVYRRTREVIAEFRPDAALIHPVCMGAHWACDGAGVPVIPANLAPISWFASRDRRVMVHWRSPDLSMRAAMFDAWVGRHVMRLMLDAPLNRIRRELGLARGKDLLLREFIRARADGSPLNLALWSPHFRPAAEGDPDTGVICGFPWFDDHHDHQDDSRALDRFLDDGEPPIVFSLGTAAVHVAGDFYRAAAGAALDLGRRGVLLVGRDEYRAALGPLPEGVTAFTYAPFSRLLPRGCCTVHHGGIGSTAQALRSGRPMVVIPHAHDQFDNAARVHRLGVGISLPRTRLSRSTLAQALRRVLDDPAPALAAADMGRKLHTEDGAAEAVLRIERALGIQPATGT